MAASREHIASGLCHGMDWAISALDSVRAPILIVDAGDVRLNILFANTAARRSFPCGRIPLVGSPVADHVDYTGLSSFLDALTQVSASHPSQSRRVKWLGVELGGHGETGFNHIVGPAFQPLVMLTLPGGLNPEAGPISQGPAEEAEWLRLSLRAADMFAWRWDRKADEFRVLLSRNAARDLEQRPFKNMAGLMACVHPEDTDRVSSAIQLTLEEGVELKEEFRIRVDDDSYRWHTVVGRPIIDSRGFVNSVVGATQDVTSRRLSLARAGEYSELLRSAAANTRDVLLLLDRMLTIHFCNHTIQGISAPRLAGQPVQSVLGGPNWPIHSQLLSSVIDSGEPVSFAYEAVGEDGALHKYDSRAVPTFDGGRINGLSLTISDITERVRLEREVLEISSREQERIGQDLHDGLGQELTGVALMLRSLANRLSHEYPRLAGDVDEIIRSVNHSIENARSLARGLSPAHGNRGGLVHALRSLVARSRDLYGLNVRFRSKVWPQLTLDEEQSTHLYRIAQEALSNIARHARASHAEIRFQVTDGRFTLTISDDGVGMGASGKAGSGMGLKLMAYRAGIIGARLDIAAGESGGTMIRVSGGQPSLP